MDKVYQKQTRGLDTQLLVAKLEAHQRRDDSSESSHTASKREISKRSSYVPRHAARQFSATTTQSTDSDEGSKDAIKRAKSFSQRAKPVEVENSKRTSIVNPKQFQAALSVGMSESEAIAVVTSSYPLSHRSSQSTIGKGEQQRRDSRKDSMTSKQTTGEKTRRSTHKHRSHSPPPSLPTTSSIVQRSGSMSGYKPGDAAKRNAEKRRSQIVQPQGRPVGGVMEYSLTFTDRIDEDAVADGSNPHRDPVIAAPEDYADNALSRPPLKPHDRVNWTQQSQCGDSTHDLLHWRRRKSSKITSDREQARQALEGGATLRKPSRQKSMVDMHESQNLIGDAVKMIKTEKKVKRRQSIVDFFKRL